MSDGRLWSLFADSFWKILLPGLTMTIPLTVIAFSLALVIAVCVALVQFANVRVFKQLARFYIWVFRGTPLWGSSSSRFLRRFWCFRSTRELTVRNPSGPPWRRFPQGRWRRATVPE